MLLAEGTQIMRCAGFSNLQTGERYPITYPKDAHVNFYTALLKLGNSYKITAEELKSILLNANTVVKELTGLAIIICITSNVMSQTYAYSLCLLYAVIYNKASKTLEVGTLASLIFSQLYT